MKNVVIAGYARSPFHFATKGALARVRPDDMLAAVIQGLMKKTGVPADDIEDLVVGCAMPEGEQGLNVARLVGLLAGLPQSVAGVTVNRFCGSSMQAIHIAAGAIQLGAGEAFLCGGIESMSRIPMGGFNPMPNTALAAKSAAYISMGETAENLARKYKIGRERQEKLAVDSHARAAAAAAAGKFTDEIVPIVSGNQTVDKDGCIRPGTDLKTLAELKPAFDAKGSVTAGTSSPLTDGAACVLVESEHYAQAPGWNPLLRFQKQCGRRLHAGDHEDRLRRRDPEVPQARRPFHRRHRHHRIERGLRGSGAGLHGRSQDRLGQDQSRRRRHGPGSPFGCHGRPHHRQGGPIAETRGQEIRTLDPMHRRRPGHHHHPGGGVMDIRRAAVIGAGVMGSGIAAQIANAGIPVDLLDMPSKEGNDRDAIAKGAIERMLKIEPAPLMHRDNAKLIRPGNIEDHLDRLKEADWIVEAVVENLAIKHSLYRRLAAIRKPDAVVSSNTSTILLKALTEGLPADFVANFAITHFFNPPRYMRLLEIVSPPGARSEAIEALVDFGDRRLGKGIVHCKDTPGFVANRIGVYWLQCATKEAVDGGLTVEEADAVMGLPVGIPKTGIFGLTDLVGLDLQPHVDESLSAALPKDDPYQQVRRDWPRSTS
jgi:3-hydroxyacyl-CoA dehydrogenase